MELKTVTSLLNEEIFGIEPNESVVYDAIVMQRASLRQGTHAVKNRSAVRGGGRKPWRQKELDVLVKVLSVHHNGVGWRCLRTYTTFIQLQTS